MVRSMFVLLRFILLQPFVKERKSVRHPCVRGTRLSVDFMSRQKGLRYILRS